MDHAALLPPEVRRLGANQMHSCALRLATLEISYILGDSQPEPLAQERLAEPLLELKTGGKRQ